MIKKITGNEYNNLRTLVKDTFNEFVAPDFSEEGRLEFLRFIENDENLNSLDIFGYYIEDILIGVIGMRDNLSHISLFFVGKMFQRHSFGKKLLETVIEKTTADVITVHSAPNSVNAYKYMGFKQVGDEIIENGIKFVPMEYKINRQNKKDEEYTMAELLELENTKIKKEKEEQLKEKRTENDDTEETVTITAGSIEELLSRIDAYNFNTRSDEVQTQSEKQIGQNFDFRG